MFARIERWTSVADPADSFWRSISRDNITTFYGRTEESRIVDPTDPTRIFSWLICQSYDDKGNVIVYDYKQEDSAGIDPCAATRTQSHRHPGAAIRARSTATSSAFATGTARRTSRAMPRMNRPHRSRADWMFEVVFDYGEHNRRLAERRTTPDPWPVRNDPFSSYRAGFEVRTYRLCQRVLMFHHFADEPDVGADCLVRSTDSPTPTREDPANARNPIFHSCVVSDTVGLQTPEREAATSKNPSRRSSSPTAKPAIQEEIREVDHGESRKPALRSRRRRIPVGRSGR